jgi:hypothetical protein
VQRINDLFMVDSFHLEGDEGVVKMARILLPGVSRVKRLAQKFLAG